MTSPLIRSLDSGAVDIVGDVHGEVDALHELIAALGYRSAFLIIAAAIVAALVIFIASSRDQALAR